MTGSTPLLAVAEVEHRYGGVLALEGVDLEVSRGGFLAVLGPNGAGKSTLGQIMAGAIRPRKGRLMLDGQDVRNKADALVGQGISLIPEGRRLFGQLTVEENLILGAFGRPRAETTRRLSEVYDLMPKAVQDGKDRPAVTLSGGEQQMLAVGRALMARPRALIVDEPSLGLAPILTDHVYALLAQLRRDGVAIVVFEQLANNAIKHADQVAVIDRGKISYRGSSKDPATMEALRKGYLGAS